MQEFFNFHAAIDEMKRRMYYDAQIVPATMWQGVDTSAKPEMAMFELVNIAFKVKSDFDTIDQLRHQIEPNLPWADAHFEERVGGKPINPGEEWARWPYGHSADKFRDENGQFNHNYMERYWPQHAGQNSQQWGIANRGIRHRYGDLDDVVDLFIRDPLTRQAYMPIFFPEDTGAHHLGRVPCTLGYHFMRRNNQLNVTYYIRSCDLIRHFRDDIYLTALLNMWVLGRLIDRDPDHWADVKFGEFVMVISSLHMFKNDWMTLFPGQTYNHLEKIHEYGRT